MSWLSGALGLDKNDAGDAFRKQQEGYIQNATQYRPYYDNIAQGQRDLYNLQQPQYQTDLQNEEDLLGRSTSEQTRTGYINRATANVASNYARGLNNTTSSLAARGLGDSGTMAGVIGNAETARAAAISNAANNADQYFDNAQIAREGQLTNLSHGAASGALSGEENAMHAGMGIDEYGAGQYGSLAQQAYQAQAARQAAASNALGGFVSTALTAYGTSQGVPVSGSAGKAGTQTAGGGQIHPYYSDGSEYGYTGDPLQDEAKDISEGN